MLKLSPRLNMAADMVRPGSVIADIGTDHAFLPSFLVLSGVSPRAIASDLRRGPLCNAKATLEQYGLQDKITLCLSDGLDNIRADEADDFIICGMGGTLIADILKRAPWLKDESKRIILQPQSHSEDVRRFLADNGFKIICEAVCEDNGKAYNAMCAQYDGKIVEHTPGWYYVGLLPGCTLPQASEIIRKTYNHLRIRMNAIKNNGGEELKRLHATISEIQEIIGDT